jgi:hypothetical protein
MNADVVYLPSSGYGPYIILGVMNEIWYLSFVLTELGATTWGIQISELARSVSLPVLVADFL